MLCEIRSNGDIRGTVNHRRTLLLIIKVVYIGNGCLIIPHYKKGKLVLIICR
jgi:hypothetical protein